ncbi:hypothetical protein LXL04_013779 [Taraxacum kok-saghyz]
MAQYGGEQYGHKEGDHHTDEHAHNPLQSTGVVGHETEGTKISTIGTEPGYVHEQGKHNGTGTGDGAGGILHRSGSGSSSSSEDDGEGGRRKKKGVAEKIKEKLPGGDEHQTSTPATVGGTGVGYKGDEGHEKKGVMDKIKEKLPGSHQ